MSDVNWHQYMVDNSDVPTSIAEAVTRRFGGPVKSATALKRGIQERGCACENVEVEKGRTARESEADGVTYVVRWDFEYCPQCRSAWYWVPEIRGVV